MSTHTAIVPPPVAAGLSQLERVVDIFIAPTKTFKDILRSASCWLPILLLIVSSLGVGYVVSRQVGFDRVAENAIQASPRAQEQIAKATPAQKAQIEKIGVIEAKVGAYGAPFFILIFIAIYALVLWASFNFGLGAQTKYAQVFAVSMYAALPYLVISLLTVLTLYFGGNAEGYDIRNPVGTNLAFYLPETTGALKGLLTSLDVVKLWCDVLQVIGMAIIAKKTLTQSAIIVGIFWLIGVAFTVVGAIFA